MVVKISSKTDLIILIIGGITTVFILAFLILAGVVLFSPHSKINEIYTDCCNNTITWTLLGVNVIILFIIFAIVLSFSILIRKLVDKWSILPQCKCLSIIGYGGIALCGIVPRICVYFFVGNDLYINGYIAFISIATSILIYLIIIRPNTEHFEVDYDLDGTFSMLWKQVVLHITMFIIVVRIALGVFEDGNDIATIIACQFGFSGICVPSIFDFCLVLREGGVKSRYAPVDTAENTNGAENNTIVKVVKIPEPNKVECNICAMEYSERRIPRNLKECGHTVCEVCANELLKKNNQIFLRCPFCQEVTVVKGPAKLLPKNFGMLDVIEKMK